MCTVPFNNVLVLPYIFYSCEHFLTLNLCFVSEMAIFWLLKLSEIAAVVVPRAKQGQRNVATNCHQLSRTVLVLHFITDFPHSVNRTLG